MTERISDAEHAVMEVLWDEAPLTAQGVAERDALTDQDIAEIEALLKEIKQ